MASTNSEPATSIIKSDRSGRRRYTQEYKDEVLAAYEASGMSGPAFAGHCGVKYPTFAAWAAKRRQEGDGQSGPGPLAPGKFVIAEFGAAPGPGALRVELPGGAAAELASPAQAGLLAALIRELTA
jgi:transposase-like protein